MDMVTMELGGMVLRVQRMEATGYVSRRLGSMGYISRRLGSVGYISRRLSWKMEVTWRLVSCHHGCCGLWRGRW